ncbi:hypothetical protein F0M18_00725 [Pseudohalioglobus sediminis]|uniref:Uncharacterized protein n=1 Tax=Pseudohalioglobus sediminis TaxID=2606449 RepID=A0A5B0X427_9GAMM|nr:hypothetical protein [Pseudohalioglobus sediminis]KAA1194002.1 hypothetical protein F0M18_00725 [Pseudohalioglobus sediminis]
MSRFENAFSSAFSSYSASEQHNARIGTDAPEVHALRKSLLRRGKSNQAAAITGGRQTRTARQHQGKR